MTECCETSAHTTGTDAVFTRTLAALKRRGCGLLLVGPDAGSAMSRACERFLGDASAEPRRRLFVRTGAHIGCDFLHSVGPGVDERNLTVIDRTTPTRSAIATAVGADRPHVGLPDEARVEVAERSLPALGIAISEAIEEFEAASGGLDSGELRLCFDSLMPLLEEYEREAVFRFLHVLVGRARHANGMAHFHLPADVDSSLVRTLAPAFDATVEVRSRPDQLEQRWHLPDDVTTDWLSL